MRPGLFPRTLLPSTTPDWTIGNNHADLDVCLPDVPLCRKVQSTLAARVRGLIEKLNIVYEKGGAADERWYWLTPMLLDFAEFPAAARAWWGRADLTQIWAGIESSEEDAGWFRHVDEAVELIYTIRKERRPIGPQSEDFFDLSSAREGKSGLGPPPDDLFDVLALAASAAPATSVVRCACSSSDIRKVLKPNSSSKRGLSVLERIVVSISRRRPASSQ